MTARKDKHFLGMTHKEQMFYTTHYHGIAHAIISSLLSIYCFAFADGQPNTTWFHCNFYKLHMFEIQKFCQLFSIGYLIHDAVICTQW